MSSKVSYSIGDFIFIVETWYLYDENATILLQTWSATFKHRSEPSQVMIRDLIKIFERFRYVTDDLKRKTFPKKTVRTEKSD